ncbi:hypothetical protein IW261DRAFT_1672270 [Armillaria novae-zelandiae]|uniref:DUF6535 domain-containing protein n=1 Tax=Armillaria novae-zelandiae TaxID=153914 RepID=A0AA39TUW8_9AGAR|nr:hypothetical protein IW261DRAFT_1672270 [Armillaria novae-zelandiae]
MSDEHPVAEGSSRHPYEGTSKVQDHPEGSSPKNISKSDQNNEEKPGEVKTDKGKGKATVKDDRGTETTRPDPGLKTGTDPSNYEEKYPVDKVYEETGPNARDGQGIEGKSRCAPCFCWSFLSGGDNLCSTDSRRAYRQTTAQVSASLLFEMVLIQRAIANGSSLDSIPVSSLNPFTTFTPATTDVWVNGLWFMSLSLSLATALVAVLVKQWLHHYLALPSGPSREQSHVRQFRYGGFQKWHVLVIIGLLPVLMHLALGIFFIGLTIFLVPLRPGFSWVIGVGTVVAYLTYLISIFLPILYPQCPYRTPLSDLVYFPYHYITQDFFPTHVHPLFMKAVERPDSDSESDSTVEKPRANISSLDDLERGAVQEQSETLSVEALHWLYTSSSNHTVHAVVIQSIGGLPVSAMAAVKTVFGEATHICVAYNTLIDRCLQYTIFSWRPLPGMESKMERLLRFGLFIPYWFEWHDELNSRTYIKAADEMILAQSNGGLQSNSHKRSNLRTPTAFFHQIISPLSEALPPVIWLGLMRAAKGDGTFNPIDIDSLHDFPVHLCHVDPWARPIVRQEPSSPVLFEIAVQDNFPEEFVTNMLNVLSSFNKFGDKTSFPITLTLALASIRYLLHRISLQSSEDYLKYALVRVLTRFAHNVAFDELPDEQIAAFSDLMEYTVVHSSVFEPQSTWTHAQMILVGLYSAMVGASSSQRPRHNYWPALRLLVEFLILQYDTPPASLKYVSYDDTYFIFFDGMCNILGFGLRHGVQTVYNVFLETQCLDVFRSHHLRPGLVRVINGYVAGLAAPHTLIDSQRHLDYLHEPENLFWACCVLTTNGWGNFRDFENGEIRQTQLQGDICRDIRALARLRPSDPSWDECRQKLRDLQDDREEFFVKQRKWTRYGFEDLEPEDIKQAKDNIYLAVEELDRFFSDWNNTKLRFLVSRLAIIFAEI